MATVFAVELFEVMEQLIEKSGDDKEKLGYLREGLREIRLMRRGDHNAARLQMELERWECERGREHEADLEQMSEKSKKRLIGLIFSKMNEEALAGVFGGGEQGRKTAAMITRIKFDLPLEDRPVEAAPSGDVNQQACGSNRGQPDQRKSN